MSKLGLLPILLGVISILTFIITYCISVALDHVEPYFPYISMTGATRPESAIFGQLLTVSAILAFASIYIRYKLVSHITREEVRKVTRWNTFSLYLGFIVCVGLSIVANFQATTSLPVHLTGALLVFGAGWVYAALQTYVTYLMYPRYNNLRVARARLAITVLLLLSLVITFVSGAIATNSYGGGMERTHWSRDDLGFAEHVVSAFGEWIMAVLQMSYFFTYASDFYKIELAVHSSMNVSHLDEQPVSESLTLTQ